MESYTVKLSEDREFSLEDTMTVARAAVELGSKLGVRCCLNDATRARNAYPLIDTVRIAPQRRTGPPGSTKTNV